MPVNNQHLIIVIVRLQRIALVEEQGAVFILVAVEIPVQILGIISGIHHGIVNVQKILLAVGGIVQKSPHIVVLIVELPEGRQHPRRVIAVQRAAGIRLIFLHRFIVQVGVVGGLQPDLIQHIAQRTDKHRQRHPEHAFANPFGHRVPFAGKVGGKEPADGAQRIAPRLRGRRRLIQRQVVGVLRLSGILLSPVRQHQRQLRRRCVAVRLVVRHLRLRPQRIGVRLRLGKQQILQQHLISVLGHALVRHRGGAVLRLLRRRGGSPQGNGRRNRLGSRGMNHIRRNCVRRVLIGQLLQQLTHLVRPSAAPCLFAH